MKLKLPKPSKLWNKFISRAIGSQMRQTSTRITMELLDNAGLQSQEDFDTFRHETESRLDNIDKATEPEALSQHIDYKSLAESVDLEPLAAALGQDASFIQNLAQELLREGSVMDELASRIASNVDEREVASAFEAEEIARHVSCSDVADHMSKSEVADNIDMSELADKFDIDTSEVASHMEVDAEDLAPHMTIDTDRVEEAVIEFLQNNISITLDQ